MVSNEPSWFRQFLRQRGSSVFLTRNSRKRRKVNADIKESQGCSQNNNKLYLHYHTCTYSITKATLREKQNN